MWRTTGLYSGMCSTQCLLRTACMSALDTPLGQEGFHPQPQRLLLHAVSALHCPWRSHSPQQLGGLAGGRVYCSMSGSLVPLGRALGWGEASPLPGLHRESTAEAHAQLACVVQLLCGTVVPPTLPLLQGEVADWLKGGLGLDLRRLYPSVQTAVEGAIVGALAESRGQSIAQLVPRNPGGKTPRESVPVNALLDCPGGIEEWCRQAAELARQGYSCIKIKVGRRANPEEDALIVAAVREAIGPSVSLRADANRKWELQQALSFGLAVAPLGLEYIEEPVRDPTDLAVFFEATRVPVALDETLDEALRLAGPNPADVAMALSRLVDQTPGLHALVVKPAVVGGLEKSALIARWASARRIQVVISSAFESSLGLAVYAHLAAALPSNTSNIIPPAHGLATADWFAADLTSEALLATPNPQAGLSISRADSVIRRTISRRVGSSGSIRQFDPDTNGEIPAVDTGPNRSPDSNASPINPSSGVRVAATGSSGSLPDPQAVIFGPPPACVATSRTVATRHATYGFRVLAQGGLPDQVGAGEGQRGPPVIFLHGFLGDADDWRPIMAGVSTQRLCLAVDLPGHGETHVTPCDSFASDGAFSMEATADALASLVASSGWNGATLVGYSMGARLAVHLAVQYPSLFAGAVVVSGTAGISGGPERTARAERDDELAAALWSNGVRQFVEDWYRQPMWASLRHHPRYKDVFVKRTNSGDPEGLSAALSGMSLGRAPSMWDRVRSQPPRILAVAGSFDTKFRAIAERLASLCGGSRSNGSMNGKVPDRVLHIPAVGESTPGEGNAAREGSTARDGSTIREGSTAWQVCTAGEESISSRKVPREGNTAREQSTAREGSAAGESGDGVKEPQGNAEEVCVDRASQAVVVEGCGHAVHIESPLALLQEILRFIA
eukprot:jgi/Botrbrau1/13488/Bobra.0082s0084.1